MSFARFEAAPEHLLAARFEAFRQREAYWLDDFALYQSIRDANDGLPWTAWPDDIMRGDPGGRERWRTALADKVRFHEFVQFLFDEQWHELRLFADRRGVRILGDIPIYVSLDSADVWANQHLFALDLRGSPTVVAGVPPDYFSAAGQLWGNPCYLWRDMKNDKYRWWIERFRRMFELSDIARVDHFRAFQAGWQVDAGEESAINGRWVEGPGEDLFDCVERSLGPLEIVVEDLGIITDDVKALRDRLGFPGMKVLQFAFGGENDNPYLPHNFDANCVVYTGTHDNDTTVGWFERSDARTRDHVERYLGHLPDEMHWAMIRLAYASVASTVIVPAQDLLGLGSEHRMNIPGTPHGNWEWRAMPGAFSSTIADRLRELATTYRRTVQAGV